MQTRDAVLRPHDSSAQSTSSLRMALRRHLSALFRTTTILLILLLPATTTAHYVNAVTNNDDPVVASLPQCARECFSSFLVANFAGAHCSSDSALQCVCERTGESGFTAGEGALQCLAAAKTAGICTEAEADSASFLFPLFSSFF